MSGPADPSSRAAAARLLPALVTLSGFAALVYQSLWLRAFGLIFGGTTSAVAMVLAVFMAGLAIGSALAARRPAARPLRAYARLELLAGAAALATLPLLRGLPLAYGAVVARAGVSGVAEAAGIAALAAAVLLPPTILLGATVPLAVEFLARSGRGVHAGFGRLYLLNTLGGALGAGIAPFVLVPALGVRLTFVAAAACSLLAGGVALRLSREAEREASRPAGESPAAAPPAETWQPAPGDALAAASAGASAPPATDGAPAGLGSALAFASGAATFGLEVLWTRSYALVVGSSVYAFAVVLVAVLLGIAAGSFVYGARRERIRRPARLVGVLFVLAGLAVLSGQWAIGQLPIAALVALDLLPVSFDLHQAAWFGLSFATLLPVCLALGLTFPLLLHLSQTGEGAQRAAGRLYAWSTAGAIAGALAADLVLVPRLGLQPPYLVFAAVLVAGGSCALGAGAGRSRAGLVAAALILAGAALAAPRFRPWDPVLVTSGVHRYGLEWVHRLESPRRLAAWLREHRTLLFYEEGREATVAVAEARGSARRFLSVNGKTDAGSGTEDVVTQKFIAHVPLLVHGSARRVLVIGWGAGATAAAAAAHPVERLECVEIEPATWRAASLFPEFHGPLAGDPRFAIVFRDGRNHLLRSPERFDAILSEPSNPWITGVSNLFTREFLEAARERLAPGGVFAQWFHYYNLQPADVKVQLRTFLSVFEHASLWLVPPVGPENRIRSLGADMLLVGSREPQRLDWPRLERAFGEPRLARELRGALVLDDPLALAAAWTMGRPELERYSESDPAFRGGTPLNTDDHPYLEFVAPRSAVMRPSEAARLATQQYEAMGRAAGDVRRMLEGVPALAEGGAAAAALLRELAERYVGAAQPERALHALAAAIDEHPVDAVALARAGALLQQQGRPREALERYEQLVHLDSSHLAGWEAVASLTLDLRDYPRSEAAHRELIALDPRKAAAWLRLAAILARQEKWREAREAIARALALDPKANVDPQLVAFLDQKIGQPAASR